MRTVIRGRVARRRARRAVPEPGRHTRVGPREERALRLLAWAGFLTTDQLARAAGYPKLRRAQRRLRVLLDHGLVRVELQSGALHRPSIHLLTRQGVEYLADGHDGDQDLHPARPPRAQKRAHALMVREVFVTLVEGELRSLLRLEDFRFEGALMREERFRTHGLVPDAIASLSTAGGDRRTLGIECDAGTETTTTLRKKLGAWRALLLAWRPERFRLVFLAEREGRRRTLGRLLDEAGFGDGTMALTMAELGGFVGALGAPHDMAARVGRAERRGLVVEGP